MTRIPVVMQYHPYSWQGGTYPAACYYCGRDRDAYWHNGALRIQWKQRRWGDQAHIARASNPSRGVCGQGVEYVCTAAGIMLARLCAECIDGYVGEREATGARRFFGGVPLLERRGGG